MALARKAIDALDRGDFDALAWPSSALMSSPGLLEGVPQVDEAGCRGRAGCEWIELMWENAKEEGVHIEIEQITDLGMMTRSSSPWFSQHDVGGQRRAEYRTWQIVWFADGLITQAIRLLDPCRSPQDRRAAGVGDVAGERGGRFGVPTGGLEPGRS